MGPSIENRVVQHIAEKLGVPADRIGLGSRLADLPGDSLDQVEMVIALEEEFDIDVPDDEAGQLETVGHVVEYIADALERKNLRPPSRPSPAAPNVDRTS